MIMRHWLSRMTTQCEANLTLKAETDDAILVQSLHGDEVRLPKGMLTGFQDNLDGTCEIAMSEWAAFKFGLT